MEEECVGAPVRVRLVERDDEGVVEGVALAPSSMLRNSSQSTTARWYRQVQMPYASTVPRSQLWSQIQDPFWVRGPKEVARPSSHSHVHTGPDNKSLPRRSMPRPLQISPEHGLCSEEGAPVSGYPSLVCGQMH